MSSPTTDEQSLRLHKLGLDIQRHHNRALELQQIIAQNASAAGADLVFLAMEKKVCEDLVADLTHLARSQPRTTPAQSSPAATVTAQRPNIASVQPISGDAVSKSKQIREQRKKENPELYLAKEKERKKKQRERKKQHQQQQS